MSNYLSNEKLRQFIENTSRRFSKDGFHIVGINTLLKESVISKMTIYKYFPTKESLIIACLKSKNESLKEQVKLLKNAQIATSYIDLFKKIYDLHTDLESDYFLLFKGIFELKSDYPEAYKIIAEYRKWLIYEILQIFPLIKTNITLQDAYIFLFIIDGALSLLVTEQKIDDRHSLFNYFLSAACEIEKAE
ncbi:TetR/AcrR family transcriptional regulator [Acinetobacter baumannii]